MTPDDIALLRENSVTFYTDPATGRLRYRAPRDALYSLTLCHLIARAADEYEERSAIREHAAGLTRVDAEAQALADLLGGT